MTVLYVGMSTLIALVVVLYLGWLFYGQKKNEDENER